MLKKKESEVRGIDKVGGCLSSNGASAYQPLPIAKT